METGSCTFHSSPDVFPELLGDLVQVNLLFQASISSFTFSFLLSCKSKVNTPAKAELQSVLAEMLLKLLSFIKDCTDNITLTTSVTNSHWMLLL